VPLGADDVQAARSHHLVVQRLPFVAQLLRFLLLVGVADRGIGFDELDLLFDVAAQHDIGAATGHVGGDSNHLRPSGLGDDFRLTRMLLRIQHVMRQICAGQDT